MILEVVAICETAVCEERDVPHIFDIEEESEVSVFCGKCKQQISNITVSEKEA